MRTRVWGTLLLLIAGIMSIDAVAAPTAKATDASTAWWRWATGEGFQSAVVNSDPAIVQERTWSRRFVSVNDSGRPFAQFSDIHTSDGKLPFLATRLYVGPAGERLVVRHHVVDRDGSGSTTVEAPRTGETLGITLSFGRQIAVTLGDERIEIFPDDLLPGGIGFAEQVRSRGAEMLLSPSRRFGAALLNLGIVSCQLSEELNAICPVLGGLFLEQGSGLRLAIASETEPPSETPFDPTLDLPTEFEGLFGSAFYDGIGVQDSTDVLAATGLGGCGACISYVTNTQDCSATPYPHYVTDIHGVNQDGCCASDTGYTCSLQPQQECHPEQGGCTSQQGDCVKNCDMPLSDCDSDDIGWCGSVDYFVNAVSGLDKCEKVWPDCPDEWECNAGCTPGTCFYVDTGESGKCADNQTCGAICRAQNIFLKRCPCGGGAGCITFDQHYGCGNQF